MYLRIWQHLLPRGQAWQINLEGSNLRQFFGGFYNLSRLVRFYADEAYFDLFPVWTRKPSAWLTEFALAPLGISDIARLNAAWKAVGGQSPAYIQSILHAAGFTSVYVHEFWVSDGSGPPFVAHDPRDYTTQPLIGEYQCEADGNTPWECYDAGPGDPLAAHCDDSLANDPGYVTNLDLTRRSPPPVPDDPKYWPYFLYFSGQEFPELAPVDSARVDELKELILKISPAQQWLVLLIDPLDAVEAEGWGFGSGDWGSAELGV